VEGEKKDEEKTESKEKKFNIPKIKTPKVIKEIRSRSKSREKKKNKEGESSGDGGEAPEAKKEGEASAEGAEGEEKKDDGEEKKDLVTEARAKVKDAMENINLPKMPKLHRPEFVKEYIKKPKDGEKTEGEETAEKADENKEGETSEEKKEEEPKEQAEGEEAKKEEEKSSEEKVEGAEEKKDADKKTSIIDSLKNIKSQVFPKKKGETSETDGEKSICFASATETEWREEKIGASAGLSFVETEKKIPMTASPSGCLIASPMCSYFELK